MNKVQKPSHSEERCTRIVENLCSPLNGALTVTE
jgi:hypothetical protein